MQSADHYSTQHCALFPGTDVAVRVICTCLTATAHTSVGPCWSINMHASLRMHAAIVLGLTQGYRSPCTAEAGLSGQALLLCGCLLCFGVRLAICTPNNCTVTFRHS